MRQPYIMKEEDYDIDLPMENGAPYDRGGADSYYQRPFDPHYWPEGTNKGLRVEKSEMTEKEIIAYTIGFDDNEDSKNFKDYS